MENFEMILEDFNKDQLDNLIFRELGLNKLAVKSSHFFDKESNKDIEFYQVRSFQDLLSPFGTGNILLYSIELGYEVHDVIMIFSFDEILGDITFNFSEKELYKGEKSEISIRITKMLHFLINLKSKFNIPKIKIGFEPAYDKANCLVEIAKDEIDVKNIMKILLQ
ncbi:hypothetical protein [Paenibacillus wulumuqiensis]|uniref:hypothetical protein n=1 Tax=Paenibacillus wulumuqiensis TaxID=1567107 RepID=UPI0006192E11|nr:hypothetical protein [Paenibacillus wulumuqiensis]